MKRFLVFYNDLPSSIALLPRSDKEIALVKDGLRPYRGMKFARVTVTVRPVSPQTDRDREQKVLDLLEELERNGQIIGFSTT
jgi:hypothetical protein